MGIGLKAISLIMYLTELVTIHQINHIAALGIISN